MADMTIDEAIEQFRDAIYGKDVRSGLIAVAETVKEAVENQVVSVDDTFTEKGKGADANAVGLALKASAGAEIIGGWQSQCYYKLDGDIMTVDGNNPVYTANYDCLIAECEEGDIFAYTGESSNAARKIAFLSTIDGENNVLWKNPNNTLYSVNYTREAPAGSHFVIAQANRNSPYLLIRLPGTKRILANSNLNDFLQVGNYACLDSSDRATITNVPSDLPEISFQLSVELMTTTATYNNSGVLKLCQILKTASVVRENMKIYYRTYNQNSGFSEWYSIYDGASVPLETRKLTAIQSGDDLNDYIGVGSYYCTSYSVARTILNAPLFVPSSFSLFVINSKNPGTETSYIRQILFANKYQTSSIYTRALNTVWGEWQILVTGNMLNSPMVVSDSSYLETKPTGTVKKVLRVATNNVAHYWCQGSTTDYLSEHPVTINKWRRELMKMNADIMFLQECEDYIDANRRISAFNTLYSPFFDSDTNIDTNPPTPSDPTRRDDQARRKILNKLGLDTNSVKVDVMSLDSTYAYHVWYNWVVVTIPNVGSVLLVNAHNFSGSSNAREMDRKHYLDVLAEKIEDVGADYFIIAGDFNISSDADKNNLLAFCSSTNSKPANGGTIGWFATHSVEEIERPFDNIIVSNNIRFKNIECNPTLIPSKAIHTDHIPVFAELELFGEGGSPSDFEDVNEVYF